jgi:hypothetical protein
MRGGGWDTSGNSGKILKTRGDGEDTLRWNGFETWGVVGVVTRYRLGNGIKTRRLMRMIHGVE